MTKSKIKPLKVGLVGCGAMGSYLAMAIQREFPREAHLSGICDHHQENLRALSRRVKPPCREMTLEEILKESDVILEAASQDAACEILTHRAVSKKTILIMSVGGILKALEKDARILRAFTGQILVPSGAIAGIDGLLAAREAGLRSVTLKTRKPPAGLLGAPYFKMKSFPSLRGDQEVCVFKGSALQAVKAFPQNVNVAAVLSLAGMGAAKTRVEVWTSKAYTGNQHEVVIEHRNGRLRIAADNEPSKENPKTSALAIYAALACLRKHFASLKMGT